MGRGGTGPNGSVGEVGTFGPPVPVPVGRTLGAMAEPDDAVLRVFLLDDHEIVRQGLRDLIDLEPDLRVVGEADSVATALDRIPATQPDVAVLDLRLPDGSGIEVCRAVRDRLPSVRCLMLTSFADDEALLASVLAGASGYVLKQVRGADIVDGIRRAGRGESLVDEATLARVAARLRSPAPDELGALGLTLQERKVLDGITDGRTNRQIAADLGLSEKTVKNYVSHLLMKLGMQRRTEVAAYGARLAERAAERRSG